MLLMPWLKYICPDLIGYTNATKAMEGVLDIAQETYDEHIKTFQVSGAILSTMDGRTVVSSTL